MILTQEKLSKLDTAYQGYNRKSINFLVSELRKIRRLIEKGEIFQIENSDVELKDFTGFYFWANDRYPALEDDPKVEWIGMD
jgi:hypothetical protein